MFLIDTSAVGSDTGVSSTGATSTVVYSASDLTAAAQCEWALMRKLDARLGRVQSVVEEADAMFARTAELGDAHEQRTLQRLRATRSVVEFQRPDLREPGALKQSADATIAALAGGAEALFQATFFDGRFLGYADFIIRNADGAYEVYDTKLARKAKITALLQLAAYSGQLEQLGIRVGEHVHLLLGDGSTSTHRIRDVLPVYRKRRTRLQHIVDERLAAQTAIGWGDADYGVCGRCSTCEEQVQVHRDVLLVAGMRLGQRKKLNEVGIRSIEQLAETAGAVPGISSAALTALREQASLQISGNRGGALTDAPGTVGGRDVPRFDVFNPSALGALPAPDAGDIFFDFEGDPLYSEGDGPQWGIDYLFGLVEADGSFRAFWAHSFAEERRALIEFLKYVQVRLRRHPTMHIYHYASYERTHLLSLAARHGFGEDQVDDLLRANVLVDLLPIVKKSMRVGSRSYSIKKLEPLYMDEHRAGVDNAADSITEYAEARRLQANGETNAAQTKLDAIAEYNEYDCISTLRLRDWLLQRAAENSVREACADDLELDFAVHEPSPVHLELTDAVGGVAPADRSADQSALALASAAIDYHRREGKKFWQEHYDRLRNPVEEWADTRDVLIVELGGVSVDRDWYREGRQRLERRILRITGVLAPGSSIKVGHKPFLLYDEPYPPITGSREPGARTANGSAEVVDIIEADGETFYFVEERLEKDAPQHVQCPMALVPAMPPNPKPQPEAIAEWGRNVLDALPKMLPDAALDILRRHPPRGPVLPVVGGDFVSAIKQTLLGIDRSYLAVQGPPGTGKTYTGSRVIADLVVNHGWKIGVVAQSHAAVENMLGAILAAGLDPSLVGKKPRRPEARVAGSAGSGASAGNAGWRDLDDKGFAAFRAQNTGWVLGGTAWDFSNSKRVPRESLDLLVIDEAGQFSLAATIASSVAASRLLLLGDPQQLPQVSQGTHPEPVDESALGWLSEGHDVLPAEFGYFLANSWRMHPDVCAPVSRLSYEGKLESVAPKRNLAGIRPGLHAIAVDHTLNSTSSIEEADRVLEIVQSLLGKAWSKAGVTAPLGERDLIVVAPYNAQVDLIRQSLHDAGLGGVPVGTVDKFQGAEAAVAIVSLSASSAEEVPRGLEFLLLPNRINVAISRAQWAAYLLYAPALTQYLPTNITGLAQLSAFIDLVDSGVTSTA